VSQGASKPGSPVEEFLGVRADAGPAAMLGLDAPADEAGVLAALRARLAHVSEHPRAMSPEADEVRLLLHAAAARLLDPHLREEYLPAGAGTPPASAEASVLLTMGMHGGWNRESLRRLTLLAESQGIPRDQLVNLIRQLTTRGESPTPTPTPTPRSRPVDPAPRVADAAAAFDSPLPEQIDPGVRTAKVIALFAGGGLLAVGVLAVVLVIALGDKSAPSVPGGAPKSGTSAAPAASGTDEPRQLFPAPAAQAPPPKPDKHATPTDRVGDFGDILREITACVAVADVEPEAALERFAAASAAAGSRWPETAPDAQLAAINGQIDFLYRVAPRSELARRALDAIAAGAGPASPVTAERVAPAVWNAGVLARLTRERDLPSGVREDIRRRLDDAFKGGGAPGEASFRSGAAAALLALPDRILTPPPQPEDDAPKRITGAWQAWLRAVEALSGEDADVPRRLKLHTLERLLVVGPEPTQSQPVYDAVVLLTTSLGWRKGDDERRALLRWFDSPAVSVADLHTVTSALATRSGAQGVDYSMALSLSAGESQRAELRARYAAVWGLDAEQSREALISRWAESARAVLDAPADDASPAMALARALRVARLNEAATRLWTGDLDGVPDSLSAADRPPSAPAPPVAAPSHRPAFGGTDSAAGVSWAVRYLAVGQHIGIRREILANVTAAPNSMEAEVLVDEACRGSPFQVRAAARALVLKYASEATVINAMLEMSPLLPATAENADLVRTVAGATIPSHRSPAFRVAVRRALVERLLQALAGEGEQAFADQLSDELARSYAARAAPARSMADTTADRAPPPLEASARAARAKLLAEARGVIAGGKEPWTLAALEQRRAARERVAVGRVKQFAAEQVNACELLAYLATAESAGRAPECVDILLDLETRRRNATHVFAQMEAAERAQARLWLLRFGVPKP
jgi:hypothetical protein